MVKQIESMGIRFGNDLNAYTSFDETLYMLPIPSDKFEEGMRIMENWAFHLAFEDQEIDDERGVILEEWRLGKGAMDRMREKFFPVLLYGSKYPDRMPLGKEEILKTFPTRRSATFTTLGIARTHGTDRGGRHRPGCGREIHPGALR